MKKRAWKDDALAATRGSRTGAILRCAMGVERDAVPRFVGKATVTSDGFLMCGFIDARGNGHHGAMVGRIDEFQANRDGLIRHLGLNARDSAELRLILNSWIGQDWRRY